MRKTTEDRPSEIWRRREGYQITETTSHIPLREVYTAQDIPTFDWRRDLGMPGEFPFTRGIHPNMYRGKLWSRRVFQGTGSTQHTNEMFRHMIERGATSLFVVLDIPSMSGVDPDHPLAWGLAGLDGLSISRLADVRGILDGISPEDLSVTLQTSLTGPVLIGAYLAYAEEQGFDKAKLRGSIMNDPLHCIDTSYSFLLQGLGVKFWARFAIDAVEYCIKHAPVFYPLVVCGYDVHEKGGNAIHEIAFAFAEAIIYIEAALERGLDIDDVASRIMFSSGTDMEFFEEIAKLRAARRVWARLMRDRFGAKNPRSQKLLITIHTMGSSLYPQRPTNNIIRTTIESLAAVLGGVQSLDPCGYDEPFVTPAKAAAQVALDIQNILAYEAGVAAVADPLGGSYYVEYLTNELEKRINNILKEMDDMGGPAVAYESGWTRHQLEKEATEEQRKIEEGKKIIVGLNEFRVPPEEEIKLPIHYEDFLDDYGVQKAKEIQEFKKTRDNQKVDRALEKLGDQATNWKTNLMPFIIDALKADATLGEIMGIIREANGASYDPLGMVQRSRAQTRGSLHE